MQNPITKEWPGVDSILNNNFINVCDKNKIPLASIRSSLDLQKPQESDNEKPFLYVLENVNLTTETEDLQLELSKELGV